MKAPFGELICDFLINEHKLISSRSLLGIWKSQTHGFIKSSNGIYEELCFKNRTNPTGLTREIVTKIGPIKLIKHLIKNQPQNPLNRPFLINS